ncbi:MAG: murein hydrolase activator EnvC [Bacteroidales bacterium]
MQSRCFSEIYSSMQLRAVFLLLLFVLQPEWVKAQDRSELEKNKHRIEQEITLLNQMLQETRSTAKLNINQLVMINNRISSRENLIGTINNEINAISQRIRTIDMEVDELREELDALRESYANMIYYAWKNRNAYQRIMFIFASRDFNQAYLRMKYLQQLTKHRQLQAEKIEETQAKLEQTIAELEQQKEEQQQLLAEQRQEIENLRQERQAQNRNVQQLRTKESEIREQIKAQERAARELQQAIERVIAEERRRAAEAARAEGRSPTEAFRLTPEDQIISDRFAENKGRLPWPLERGIITGQFGEQPHPVLPNIKIANNGIDISTTEGSRARAIFDGTVTRIFNIAGANNVVIIRHGEYLSVYANLAEVYVVNGQKINARQEIGLVATDQRESRTMVHLEVWHGNNKQNPADWIARQQ